MPAELEDFEELSKYVFHMFSHAETVHSLFLPLG